MLLPSHPGVDSAVGRVGGIRPVCAARAICPSGAICHAALLPALPRGLYRSPDTLRGHWHLDMTHAQRAERVNHSVDHRLGRGDGAGLADALDAHWVRRAGRLGARDLDEWNLPRGWHGVVHHAAAEELAAVV